MVRQADIIFLPYNYLTFKEFRSMINKYLPGSILIFDEGHNLPDFAEEGYSFKLSLDDLDRIEDDLTKIKKTFDSGNGNAQNLASVERSFDHIITVRDYLKKAQITSNSQSFPGEDIFKIFSRDNGSTKAIKETGNKLTNFFTEDQSKKDDPPNYLLAKGNDVIENRLRDILQIINGILRLTKSKGRLQTYNTSFCLQQS